MTPENKNTFRIFIGNGFVYRGERSVLSVMQKTNSRNLSLFNSLTKHL